jgi:hypothetical protein
MAEKNRSNPSQTQELNRRDSRNRNAGTLRGCQRRNSLEEIAGMVLSFEMRAFIGSYVRAEASGYHVPSEKPSSGARLHTTKQHTKAFFSNNVI